MIRRTASTALALLVLAGSSPAFATNGMNLEGYGAKSQAMGGTGMAYDTGNSAAMNNPATLGFYKEGTSELGFGIRGLHPKVKGEYGPYTDYSRSTAFYMPSISYIRRDGAISWGTAMFSQGGMGADYGDDSPLFAAGSSWNGVANVPLSGKTNRSEVGVGRVMFPIAWKVSEDTTIGASVDFVWASMDMQMDLDGAHFRRFTQGDGGTVSGSMYDSLGGYMMGGAISDINYARFDFSNDSHLIGRAVGYGTGFKIGLTQKLSKTVTIGGSYHSQTAMTDLESGNATLSFFGAGPAFANGPIPLSGKVKVRNFEWPATFAAGIAITPNEKLLITGDVKYIEWSSVMDKFSMSFTADDSVSNGDFRGKSIDVEMFQKWKNQTIWSIGVQYKPTRKLALRGGASFSMEPVPDLYTNPLFPATIKNHYTCGFGYQLNDVSSVAAAFSWAPRVTDTNGDGMVISHSQTNWALNYMHKL
ncbi:MAG: aromatic hydrocarbon degradation protein [Chlorobiaceae bacterium]|nr:aromatic hydrocarbon degradation protein [Chlorobiaceae bacterium]NTV26583.1 aromatic hydrocarbon degradation protein [Chlorobiaceae bacterium]